MTHPDHPTTDPMTGAASTPAAERPGIGRRQTLALGGAAVAALGATSACSQGQVDGAVSSAASQAGSAASSAASQAGSAASSLANDAVDKATIPVGGGKVLDNLKVVVTQPEAGTYKAFSAVCTHEGCTVGSVADGVIVCPCHNSKFDIATGEVRSGPATKPLPEKKVTVGSGGITVS